MNTAVKNKTNAFYILIFVLFSFAFALSLIVFSDAAKTGAADGLLICRDVILVSVFPFSVAASLLIGSGALDYCGKAVGGVFGRIFGVSNQGSGVILLGAVGGFPTGAYAASELYKSGAVGKNEAERLISFTNNPTPAFIIGYVGSLLGSSAAGLYCYLCILVSSFIWGVIIRKNTTADLIKENGKNSVTFSKAVSKSASSAVVICGFVIVFSVMSRIISGFISDNTVSAVICSVFEITGGVTALSALGAPAHLTASLFCAFCSFSGICILSQVKTEAEAAGLSIRYYVIGKTVQSALSFCLSYTLYPLIFA